ncbi:GCN5L1-domain-containing protein [Martensiomyces pterosporus]|nr:GCN5L1-domain-containing protein [Martensiomyces pterosporus]
MASSASSLSDILRDHQASQLEQRRTTEQLRKEAVQDIGDLCDTATTSLSAQVGQVLDNQKKIESLARDSAHLVQQHARSTAKWTKLVDQFNGALKELGDVRNWAQVIERDMLDVAATLEIVHASLNPPATSSSPAEHPEASPSLGSSRSASNLK